MLSRIPSAGAGTSSTTLSVSRSTRFSSRAMASPGFLCHLATVASETDSGKLGTLISILIDCCSLLYSLAMSQRLTDETFLLFLVDLVVPYCRRGRGPSTRIRKRLLGASAGLYMVANLEPGTLVHGFFLAPDDFSGLAVAIDD